MTYQVRGIPSALVDKMWPFAEPYIKRALDQGAGEIAAEDLRQACLARDVQLWLIADGARVVGAGTTEIVRYPRKTHCRIITLAGSRFAEWAGDADAAVSQWAVAQGCDALEAYVRRGFVPKLKEIGYKHLQSITVKKLDTMQATGMQQGKHHGQ